MRHGLTKNACVLLMVVMMAPLTGCSMLPGKSTFPRLRDIPLAPTSITSAPDRDHLKQELEQERVGAAAVGAMRDQGTNSGKKQPAVPPRSQPHAQAPSEEETNICDGSSARQMAQAVPQLRGTITDNVKPGVLTPTGVTAAISDQRRLVLKFPAGNSDLPPAEIVKLVPRAERFGTRRGAVYIDERGGGAAPATPVRSLDELRLGLKRASGIASVLMSTGIVPARIKLLVTNADGALGSRPIGSEAENSAVVTFAESGV